MWEPYLVLDADDDEDEAHEKCDKTCFVTDHWPLLFRQSERKPTTVEQLHGCMMEGCTYMCKRFIKCWMEMRALIEMADGVNTTGHSK